jgi:hypothetical protein
MKYIISESQHKIFLEQRVPISIRRRATPENLEKYILDSEVNNPPECSHYADGYDYADAVIDEAIDNFLSKFSSDIEETDEYSDILDYFRNLFRNMFGQSLVYMFEDGCTEEMFDDEPIISESNSQKNKVLRRLNDYDTISLMKEIVVEGLDVYDPCEMNLEKFVNKVLYSSAETLILSYYDYDLGLDSESEEAKKLVNYVMKIMDNKFHNLIYDYYEDTEC